MLFSIFNYIATSYLQPLNLNHMNPNIRKPNRKVKRFRPRTPSVSRIKLKSMNIQPARMEGEHFDDYKKRRKKEQQAVKARLTKGIAGRVDIVIV